jgi:hypothetical protein
VKFCDFLDVFIRRKCSACPFAGQCSDGGDEWRKVALRREVEIIL